MKTNREQLCEANGQLKKRKKKKKKRKKTRKHTNQIPDSSSPTFTEYRIQPHRRWSNIETHTHPQIHTYIQTNKHTQTLTYTHRYTHTQRVRAELAALHCAFTRTFCLKTFVWNFKFQIFPVYYSHIVFFCSLI